MSACAPEQDSRWREQWCKAKAREARHEGRGAELTSHECCIARQRHVIRERLARATRLLLMEQKSDRACAKQRLLQCSSAHAYRIASSPRCGKVLHCRVAARWGRRGVKRTCDAEAGWHAQKRTVRSHVTSPWREVGIARPRGSDVQAPGKGGGQKQGRWIGIHSAPQHLPPVSGCSTFFAGGIWDCQSLTKKTKQAP